MMERTLRTGGWSKLVMVLMLAACAPALVASRAHAKADQQMLDEFKAAHPELFPGGRGTSVEPEAIPDVFGPGAVLTAGSVYMKVTNLALFGNPFINLSSDPSGQWPGASGVEYLAFSILSVAGVNPVATDPAAVRRVSYFQEWRPPTLAPEDRMYRAYEGVVNGARLADDDQDGLIDEDFLDGRDNDGDSRIDEDYGAIGQQMFTCVIRDDTPQAINTVFNERHIPLGLEVHQAAFAFANPRLANFNAVEYTVYNRSGHELDSMFVAFRIDMDCGPIASTNYFTDDFDMAPVPNGIFSIALREDDPRRQFPHYDVNPVVPPDSALCPRVDYRISGFTVVDDNNDAGRTTGAGTFLLLGHTVDPLGIDQETGAENGEGNAPGRVAFRAFRSYTAGAPYEDGGNPNIDQQRFEFMSSTQNIDQETGLIVAEPSELPGDYQAWASVGPFRHVPNNGSFQVTVAFAVQRADYNTLREYSTDYQRYRAGAFSGPDLREKYPVLDNALTAQVAYEGVYEVPRQGLEELVPGGSASFPFHGRETPRIAERGQLGLSGADCHDEAEGAVRPITEFEYTWFDQDCNYCTGVYDRTRELGLYLRRWNTESPPPSPNLNVTSNFNFPANPARSAELIAAGDGQVRIAWDNLSEVTVDPERREFDFRSYRLWKAANWTRPIGSSGPNDEDWSLIGEFRLFDYTDSNFVASDTGLVCPTVVIPEYYDPVTRTRGPREIPICLYSGDLWNQQSGEILRPSPVDCERDENNECEEEPGINVVTQLPTTRTKYPVGRYRYVDREVKNGFLYFYSVTAGDSGRSGESFGRRSAVESDGVTPQISAGTGRKVWVVPNPYRGFRNISERPSSWDLTPNAGDPTGTHIDFFGLPTGQWTIKVFTISGDLVAEIHSDDPVNESIRGQIVGDDGQTRDGFNRQQDNPNDGQARWNLISRNGQDIVSGIYMFVVDSSQGQQRGKFVVIR
jgi:hypothetical protein